jgi:hypothetical protein
VGQPLLLVLAVRLHLELARLSFPAVLVGLRRSLVRAEVAAPVVRMVRVLMAVRGRQALSLTVAVVVVALVEGQQVATGALLPVALAATTSAVQAAERAARLLLPRLVRLELGLVVAGQAVMALYQRRAVLVALVMSGVQRALVAVVVALARLYLDSVAILVV